MNDCKILHKAVIIALGLSAFSELAVRGATTSATPKVALLDFTVDDRSYRSGQAAADFSSALQVALSGEDAFEWVERAQLQTADQEMQLSAAGLMSVDAALRRGHWAKADWLLSGLFMVNESKERILRIEVTDVRRAEVLGSTNIVLAGGAQRPIKSHLAEIAPVAQQLGGLLNAVRQQYQKAKDKKVVALLHFHSVKPTTSLWPSNTFGAEFVSKLSQELAVHPAARLITLSRANEGLGENALAVTGLTDGGPDFLAQTADAYLLGVCGIRFTGRPSANPSDGPYVFDAEITVLRNKGGSQTVSEKDIAPSQIEVAAQRLAHQCIEAAIAEATDASFSMTPQTIALSLQRRADEIIAARAGRSIFVVDLEGRLLFHQLTQMYETVCFLDPANKIAHEQLLFLRFDELVRQQATNQFAFLWKANEAWGEHLDRFGPATASPSRTNGPPETGNAFNSRYASFHCVRSSLTLLADIFASGNRLERGYPNDVPPEMTQQWRQRVEKELVKRALMVTPLPEAAPRLDGYVARGLEAISSPKLKVEFIEGIWPAVVRRAQSTGQNPLSQAARDEVTETFRREGKPERAQQFLAMRDVPKSPIAVPPKSAPVNPSRPTTRDVPKSPISASQATTPLNLPRFSSMFSNNYAAAFKLPPLDLLPARATANVEVVEFPKERAVYEVQSMAWKQGELWMSAQGAEAASVADDNRERTAGLIAARVQTHRVWIYSPATRKTRLASPDEVASADSILPPSAAKLGSILGHADSFADSPRFGVGQVHAVVTNEGGGYWFGTEAGLHFVDPDRKQIQNWYAPRPVQGVPDLAGLRQAYADANRKNGTAVNPVEPTSRLTAWVAALCSDGEFLWVACIDGVVFRLHKPSRRWVSHFRFPGYIRSVAASGDYLLIGVAGSPHPDSRALLQVAKTQLPIPDQNQWLPDRPSPTEVATAISRWTLRQQATYAFFKGDYSTAVQLIDADPFRDSDPEALLLLVHSHDALGLNQREKQMRYFELLRSLEPPGSPWLEGAAAATGKIQEATQPRQDKQTLSANQ